MWWVYWSGCIGCRFGGGWGIFEIRKRNWGIWREFVWFGVVDVGFKRSRGFN